MLLVRLVDTCVLLDHLLDLCMLLASPFGDFASLIISMLLVRNGSFHLHQGDSS